MATVTRVYDTYAHAKNVVMDLETARIPTSDISLVANKYVSDTYDNVDEASPTGSGAGIGAVIVWRAAAAS